MGNGGDPGGTPSPTSRNASPVRRGTEERIQLDKRCLRFLALHAAPRALAGLGLIRLPPLLAVGPRDCGSNPRCGQYGGGPRDNDGSFLNIVTSPARCEVSMRDATHADASGRGKSAGGPAISRIGISADAGKPDHEWAFVGVAARGVTASGWGTEVLLPPAAAQRAKLVGRNSEAYCACCKCDRRNTLRYSALRKYCCNASRKHGCAGLARRNDDAGASLRPANARRHRSGCDRRRR